MASTQLRRNEVEAGHKEKSTVQFGRHIIASIVAGCGEDIAEAQPQPYVHGSVLTKPITTTFDQREHAAAPYGTVPCGY